MKKLHRFTLLLLCLAALLFSGCGVRTPLSAQETTDQRSDSTGEAYEYDLIREDEAAAVNSVKPEETEPPGEEETESEATAVSEAAEAGTEAEETEEESRDVFSTGTQFRNKDRFEEHYQKHVLDQQEFGDISKEEYMALAQELVDTPGPQVLTKPDEDGNTLFYDPDTNSFAVLSRDGYIRTFFKPSAGQSYYDRQT